MAVQAWHQISEDPNAPEVKAYRAAQLARARSKQLIDDRIRYICGVVRGKDTLDIGVVEHFRDSSASEIWLHRHVRDAARSCLGMDILESEVESLRERGFDVICHDITTSPLDRDFDVIVVGDVIEHLNSPAALFENAAQMLRPPGRLVISTPNPWYANAILKNVFDGQPFTDSADHVAWFDAGTLCELANRSGLLLDRYAGVRIGATITTTKSRLFANASPALIRAGVRPEVFAKTMIYEFVLGDPKA